MNEHQNSGHHEPNSEVYRRDYLALFYDTLFNPVNTFKIIAAEPHPAGFLVFYAIMSVILVSAIAPVIQMVNMGGGPATLIFTMPISVLGGLLIWGISGLILALAAYAFTGNPRVRTFLTLSGLATLPWIMLGPISLMKVSLGNVGVAICILLALLVWLWTVLLFALALTQTYRMSADRVLIVLAAPFTMMLIFIGWIAGFVDNIRLLMPPLQ